MNRHAFARLFFAHGELKIGNVHGHKQFQLLTQERARQSDHRTATAHVQLVHTTLPAEEATLRMPMQSQAQWTTGALVLCPTPSRAIAVAIARGAARPTYTTPRSALPRKLWLACTRGRHPTVGPNGREQMRQHHATWPPPRTRTRALVGEPRLQMMLVAHGVPTEDGSAFGIARGCFHFMIFRNADIKDEAGMRVPCCLLFIFLGVALKAQEGPYHFPSQIHLPPSAARN